LKQLTEQQQQQQPRKQEGAHKDQQLMVGVCVYLCVWRVCAWCVRACVFVCACVPGVCVQVNVCVCVCVCAERPAADAACSVGVCQAGGDFLFIHHAPLVISYKCNRLSCENACTQICTHKQRVNQHMHLTNICSPSLSPSLALSLSLSLSNTHMHARTHTHTHARRSLSMS